MFELSADRIKPTHPCISADFERSTAARSTASYFGPERRQRHTPELELVTAALDEIDYGLLLINPHRRVLHSNHAAITLLNSDYPLHLVGLELRSRHRQDELEFTAAIAGAAGRGLRRLLTLGREPDTTSVSVVPLRDLSSAFAPQAQSGTGSAVLLMLGKRDVGNGLAVDAFARTNGLSPAESRVLKALCSGMTPSAIADRNGVAMSTVRTQIGSIRAKTSEPSIRALLRRVSDLPPLQSVLRR